MLSVVTVINLVLSACSTLSGTDNSSVRAYACGELEIRVSRGEKSNLLNVEYQDKHLLLKSSESASGALYIAPGEDDTRFWSKGEKARFTVQGETYPECLQPGDVSMPFEAGGNEPFWHVTVDSSNLVLLRPYEQGPALTLPVEVIEANRHGRVFGAEGENIRVVLTVARQLCEDTMSDAQFPNQAQLDVNGEVFNGCGGDPERLFRGVEWQVQKLGNDALIERSRATIRFLSDNRIAGEASCNRFSGRYTLTGEGRLVVTGIVSTRMACASELMAQEQRFLEMLGQASRLTIGRNGELRLISEGGRNITATH